MRQNRFIVARNKPVQQEIKEQKKPQTKFEVLVQQKQEKLDTLLDPVKNPQIQHRKAEFKQQVQADSEEFAALTEDLFAPMASQQNLLKTEISQIEVKSIAECLTLQVFQIWNYSGLNILMTVFPLILEKLELILFTQSGQNNMESGSHQRDLDVLAFQKNLEKQLYIPVNAICKQYYQSLHESFVSMMYSELQLDVDLHEQEQSLMKLDLVNQENMNQQNGQNSLSEGMSVLKSVHSIFPIVKDSLVNKQAFAKAINLKQFIKAENSQDQQQHSASKIQALKQKQKVTLEKLQKRKNELNEVLK